MIRPQSVKRSWPQYAAGRLGTDARIYLIPHADMDEFLLGLPWDAIVEPLLGDQRVWVVAVTL
jgi:hypothetical protein